MFYTGRTIMCIDQGRPSCSLKFNPALCEQPLRQFWFRESPFPDVVIDPGILCIEWMSACFSSSRDPVTRQGHRHSLVSVSVEVPQRSFNRCAAIVFRDTSTADCRRREKFQTARD